MLSLILSIVIFPPDFYLLSATTRNRQFNGMYAIVRRVFED